MRCLHCGEWNRPFRVIFKKPGREVMICVFATDLEMVEQTARKKLEEIGESIWDLELEKILEESEVPK